jgi:hypothetical protein
MGNRQREKSHKEISNVTNWLVEIDIFLRSRFIQSYCHNRSKCMTVQRMLAVHCGRQYYRLVAIIGTSSSCVYTWTLRLHKRLMLYLFLIFIYWSIRWLFNSYVHERSLNVLCLQFLYATLMLTLYVVYFVRGMSRSWHKQDDFPFQTLTDFCPRFLAGKVCSSLKLSFDFIHGNIIQNDLAMNKTVKTWWKLTTSFCSLIVVNLISE